MGSIRRTDCSKEIAQAEGQAAHWQAKAAVYRERGRNDKVDYAMIRARHYLMRADRMRPQLEAAE